MANQGSDNVSVIDGNTNAVIANVTVGNIPNSVGVDPLTNGIYVSNSGSANVSVIGGLSDTVVATVAVGSVPQGVGVNP